MKHCKYCFFNNLDVGDEPCRSCHDFSHWIDKANSSGWDGPITPNSYQREAMRTASGMNSQYPMYLNGVLGLAGESGECVDIVKKHLFQGHDIDHEHLAKELGDVAWYLAVTAYAIGYDLETVLRMNVDKLRARYPDGFDPDKSQHRKDGDV